LLAAFAALAARAENYLKIESPSDGRTYTIDLDRIAGSKTLRLVSGANASKLPAWLYPAAGAQPTVAHFDVDSGIAEATFACGGSAEQIAAYYAQVMREHGMRVSTSPGLGGGINLTGTSAPVAVSIGIAARAGAFEVRITHAPQHRKAPHFEVVWYDDRSGILRVRETVTGDEYEMPKHTIVANNLNRAGGVASTEARMPSWLPVFPGAAASPKGRIHWAFDPTAEFVTYEKTRPVYDFYVQQLASAGAKIRRRSLGHSGGPAHDDSAEIVAQLGDDVVEIHIGEVWWMFTGLNSLNEKRPQTGIGIKYSVPLR
jgi:hypothetical protein